MLDTLTRTMLGRVGPASIVALLAGLAASNADPAARPDPAALPTAAPQRQDQPEAPQSRTTVSFRFEGGTLDGFVAALKKAAAPAPVNVVLHEGAGGLRIEAMELAQAAPEGALEAALAQHRRGGRASDGTPYEAVLDRVTSKVGSPIFTVVIRRFDPAPPPADEQLRSAVSISIFSIDELLRPPAGVDPMLRVGPAELLTAIDTALGLADRDSGDRPEVKFHADTALLIVRGAARDLNTVDSLLHELRSDLDRQRALANEAADRRQSAEQRARSVEAELTVGRAEADAARHRLESIRKLAESGQAASGDVMAAEVESMRADAKLVHMQTELDTAHAMLSRWSAPAVDDRTPAGLSARASQIRAKIKDLQSELDEVERLLKSAGGGGR